MKLYHIGGLLLALTLSAPLSAQVRPIDPTTIRNLWPERELSPAEAELRDAVVVLRDSIYGVDAAVERIERGRRGDASPSMLRSSGYGLITECQRTGRSADRMKAYAAGLSTSDTRWGNSALTNFRESVTALVTAMAACESDLTAIVSGSTAVDPDRTVAAGQAARNAVRSYERAAQGLLKTLKINLDPKGAVPARS